MQKTCVNCSAVFSTSRKNTRVTCSTVCAKTRMSKGGSSSISKVETKVLPEPEDLPAPYAKKVHDMWVALTSNGPTRIL